MQQILINSELDLKSMSLYNEIQELKKQLQLKENEVTQDLKNIFKGLPREHIFILEHEFYKVEYGYCCPSEAHLIMYELHYDKEFFDYFIGLKGVYFRNVLTLKKTLKQKRDGYNKLVRDVVFIDNKDHPLTDGSV